jgi:adenosylcobinamide kinase / adenosylcobinamide-phosphate guanylyltransferase
MLTFITGPVRAGKSTLAERLARACGMTVVYCATGAWDDRDHEWSRRIERHRERRPAEWRTVETAEPHGVDLIATLRDAKSGTCLIVESLGTWIANVLARRARIVGDDPVALAEATETEVSALVDAVVASAADVIVVSEEVGWGVVPPYVSGRVFRDVMGRANQRVAAAADRAYLVVSGIPIDLKARESS